MKECTTFGQHWTQCQATVEKQSEQQLQVRRQARCAVRIVDVMLQMSHSTLYFLDS